jgi:hypothetical protein
MLRIITNYYPNSKQPRQNWHFDEALSDFSDPEGLSVISDAPGIEWTIRPGDDCPPQSYIGQSTVRTERPRRKSESNYHRHTIRMPAGCPGNSMEAT